jgi:hypothetical protein
MLDTKRNLIIFQKKGGGEEGPGIIIFGREKEEKQIA